MSRILIIFGTKVDEVLEKCEDCILEDGEWGCCILTGDDIYKATKGRKLDFPPSCPLPQGADPPKK